MFQDGVCISTGEESLVLDRNASYNVIVGSNGPCELSVNVGGKIFRAHGDELNKGLIDLKQLELLNIAKNRITNRANQAAAALSSRQQH